MCRSMSAQDRHLTPHALEHLIGQVLDRHCIRCHTPVGMNLEEPEFMSNMDRHPTSREGVTCIVVNDVVSVDGVPLEDTDDWLAQRKDGTVDYCGESVQDFETFEGDDPMEMHQRMAATTGGPVRPNASSVTQCMPGTKMGRPPGGLK